MSTSYLNPGQQKTPQADWARLIPGEMPATRSNPRRRGARRQASCIVGSSSIREHDVSLAVPRPLQGRTAWQWLRSTAVDSALIALNWLLLGALLVPLRALFPWIRVFSFDAGSPGSLLGLALLHSALITLLMHAEGVPPGVCALTSQSRILLKSVLWATGLLAIAYGLQTAWPTSVLICCAGALHFGTLLLWRRYEAQQHSRNSSQFEGRRVLVVGAGSIGRRLAADVENDPYSGRRVLGFLDDEKPHGERVLGRVCDLARVARTGFIDEVIIAAPQRKDVTVQVLREARRLHLDVEIVPDLFGCVAAVTEFDRVGDFPVLRLHAEPLPAVGLALKRLVDVAGSAVTLSALLPLLAIIAAAIKIDSAGPVFYLAQRAGLKGRRFRCYKFRTMVNNADQLKNDLRRKNERSGPFFKIAGDPRVTRLGRFLRRYSLDELPQLWNVLKGEMSLVGPRPHAMDDVSGYEVEHLARLDVVPGITGLWQVTARRDPSFQRGMELDREYIRSWSLAMDLRILLRTLSVVVRGSGE